jgi:uncharacterized protein (DUF1684 family)
MQYLIVPLAFSLLFGRITNPAMDSLARTDDTHVVDKDERDSIVAAIEKDRSDTERWLKSSPTSYLATIKRVDFGARATLAVGRAEDNDVRIDDPDVAQHHLTVTVTADSFRVEAKDPDAFFSTGGPALRSASVGPSAVKIGRFTVRLSHQRYPALIVFDPSSSRFAEYKGLRYFPVDLAYRYVLSLKANPRADTVVILSTRGNRRNALRVGWFVFEVGNRACRLEVTRLLEPGISEKSFSVFFRDLTCGEESYGVGRYVEAEQLADGRFVLDFNSAYNPACAFSPHYNCPIPPNANNLQVRIPAGEMDAHYLEH